MCNFLFLNDEKKYESFSGACIEAEKSLMVSYASTAILTRRALELAVKWLYSYDADLEVPYQDNLNTLIYNRTFRSVIDAALFPKIRYIQKLGNKAVHTSVSIKREQAVLALHNLFEFMCWVDYCYSEQYVQDREFDESILGDTDKEHKTRTELRDLYGRLSAKDRKLEEVIKENTQLREENAQKRADNRQKRTFNVEDISEYKTRKLYIDLDLELKGWTIGKDCIEEVEVSGMPNESGKGLVDYVLYDDDLKPLAVVEAKRTSVDPKVGQVQAKLYADCLEKQYGVRPAIFYTNGFEYYLWDDVSYPERIVSGVYTKDELQWLMYKRHNKLSLKNPHIKDEITNRPYQKMAITSVCDALEECQRKALLVMPCGTGKTRTAISIVDVLVDKGWIKHILFLADRIALVKQAKKNFKNLLPELSLCNLMDNKDDPESRMVFSTYPTMMNAIDDTKSKDGGKLFTSGHFDLIIVDESHRSIYKKYQAIFDYFDGILLGLTATPKNDIDINTYKIFELETDNPTYSYELKEAVEERYLVPYSTIETRIKFVDEGIHYDELSEDEKEVFEETFDDDVRDISSSALNDFLFNDNTVDMVLRDLMEKGIKVEGGDKIGKTVIFANNKDHAKFIVERFNALYPHYHGDYIQEIYCDISYVEKRIDEFSTKDKLPQIAVSVDMLDTGIDIPEIVNLVIFKKVRSKSKFWQMVGRGTRLCEDLFGVGLDKEEFLVFDYCGNFEFFRAKKRGREAKLVKSLTENLFNVRVDIIKELQRLDYQTEEYIAHRQKLIKEIVGEICSIDESRFDAKLKLRYIHKYNHLKAFENLFDIATKEMQDQIAPLIPPIEDDELAKRFDYLMYTIEFAELRGQIASKLRNKVVTTAQALSKKGTIEQVKRQKDIIQDLQTDEFWDNADIFEYEKVREALRDLIKYIEGKTQQNYYTNFKDEILEVTENKGEYSVNNMQNYRKRVNHYLNAHKDDIVVYKLRHNKALNEDDIKHLEQILWEEIGTKDDYKKEYGDEPLTRLVLKIVGLDRSAVNELFSKFLTDETLNIQQMEFVKLIVEYVVKNGIMDKNVLNEHPFNKYGSVVQLFDGKIEIAQGIIKVVDEINEGGEVG